MAKTLTNLLGAGLIAGSGLLNGCAEMTGEQTATTGGGMLGTLAQMSPFATPAQKLIGGMLSTGANMTNNIQAGQEARSQVKVYQSENIYTDIPICTRLIRLEDGQAIAECFGGEEGIYTLLKPLTSFEELLQKGYIVNQKRGGKDLNNYILTGELKDGKIILTKNHKEKIGEIDITEKK